MPEAMRRWIAAIGSLLVIGSAHAADEQSELQKKTEELNQQAALLEAQTKILDAQTKLMEARFPTIAGGKEGTITKGEGSLFALGATEQVYRRVAEAAGEICTRLRDANVLDQKKLALVTETDLERATRYRLVVQEEKAILAEVARVQAMRAAPAAASREFAPLGIGGAAAVLGSVVSIAKLFRTDIQLHDETVAIADAALQDAVFDCLAKLPAVVETKTLELRQPAVAGTFAMVSNDTPFLRGIAAIVAARPSVQQAADAKDIAPKAAAASALLVRIDKFVGDLYAASATSGRAPIQDVLVGEAVAAAVSDQAQLLMVSIAHQGGNSMITSNFWREDRLYVGGGVIVAFKLIQDGTVRLRSTIARVDPQFRRVPLQ